MVHKHFLIGLAVREVKWVEKYMTTISHTVSAHAHAHTRDIQNLVRVARDTIYSTDSYWKERQNKEMFKLKVVILKEPWQNGQTGGADLRPQKYSHLQ